MNVWHLSAQGSRNSEYRPLFKQDKAEIKFAIPLNENTLNKSGSSNSFSQSDIVLAC